MIQLSYRNTTIKPEKLTKDSRGIIIEPGLRVAYNYSGDVVIGKIIELKKSEWKNNGHFWNLDFELHIENENGKISKIKNPNSFVII